MYLAFTNNSVFVDKAKPLITLSEKISRLFHKIISDVVHIYHIVKNSIRAINYNVFNLII